MSNQSPGLAPPRPAPAPHPSRALPLCAHCRHAVRGEPDPDPVVLCNHPAAPVIPINGRPAVSAMHMRSAQWMNGIQEPVCGEAGQWFEPQAAAAV